MRASVRIDRDDECARLWRQSNDYGDSCLILELSLHAHVKLPTLPGLPLGLYESANVNGKKTAVAQKWHRNEDVII